MKLPVAINKLSVQTGLTSRTLRHWESEGLFNSTRDSDSGWRVYDEAAVLRISITAMLRKLDIPLKEIKSVLDAGTIEKAEEAVKKQLLSLAQDHAELKLRKNTLLAFLSLLSKAREQQAARNSLITLNDLIKAVTQQNQSEEMEDINMSANETNNNKLRFITLPPMRTVYHTAVGASPEDEAMTPVLEWLKSENLMGTARLFGGNVEPFPSKTTSHYGYGMCASIPEGIEVPAYLKEMRLPGGLYALLASSDDINNSWQLLMKQLSQSNEYTADRSRLCFEEHIRNDNPEGQGHSYDLNLLEPVKKK